MDDMSVSQNFITDKTLVQKLLNQTAINGTDTVLEIGAGKGIITKELAKKCKDVIAVEIDPVLIQQLNTNLRECPNVKLINNDFLTMELPANEFKVFSNIPFKFTSRIMNKLFFETRFPEAAYLIMQNEAADIYLGKPRETQKSLLLKPLFELSVFHKFSKSDFYPIPRVDIEMLEIQKRAEETMSDFEYADYKNFIVYGTGQSKLTLKQNLNKIFTGEQFFRLSQNLGFNKEAKPLDLSFEHWLGLFKYFQTGVSEEKKLIVKNSFDKHVVVQSGYKKRFKTRSHK